MRYAYIKYGNVLDELKAVGANPATISEGGPLAFASGFLQMVGTGAALMISLVPRPQGPLSARSGDVEAQIFARPTRWHEPIIAAKVFFQLLRFAPDVVICTRDGWLLWASFLAARLRGARFVHSRQRAVKVAGDSRRRRVIATGDGFVFRRADALICHGPFARQQLIDIGVQPARIGEFDVGFDDLLAQMRSAVAAAAPGTVPGGAERRRLVFVGRVEESKGVFELLEACLPLLALHADLDLVFVGAGQALEPLKQIVREKNLGSRVTFTGRVPHAHIGIYLDKALALATPTRHGLEGWPMAALEGLAVGVPVVGPNAGPFPFMIEHGRNGLLFEVNSAADLRAKLQNLLDDPALRDRLAAGALEYSDHRARSYTTFASALAFACKRASTA